MTEIAKYNGMMSYLTRPPAPKTQVADLVDDLEPGPLKDELLKDFDPTQEEYEEYLQRKGLGERPFNASNGGSPKEEIVEPSKSMQVDTTTKGIPDPLEEFKKQADVFLQGSFASTNKEFFNSLIQKEYDKALDAGVLPEEALSFLKERSQMYRTLAEEGRMQGEPAILGPSYGRENKAIGGGVIEGEDLGTREGFNKPQLNPERRVITQSTKETRSLYNSDKLTKKIIELVKKEPDNYDSVLKKINSYKGNKYKYSANNLSNVLRFLAEDNRIDPKYTVNKAGIPRYVVNKRNAKIDELINVDPDKLPTAQSIAKKVGVTTTTVTNYLKESKGEDWLEQNYGKERFKRYGDIGLRKQFLNYVLNNPVEKFKLDNIIKNTDIKTKKEANSIYSKLLADIYDKRAPNIDRPVLYIDENINLKDLTKKLRSSDDFYDAYERKIGSLLLEAYDGNLDSKEYKNARNTLTAYHNLIRPLNKKYPSIAQTIEHPIPYTFLTEVAAGKDPKNLINTTILGDKENTFKSKIDEVKIKLRRNLEKNPKDKKLLTQLEDMKKLETFLTKETGMGFGVIKSRFTDPRVQDLDFGAETFGTKKIVPQIEESLNVRKNVVDFYNKFKNSDEVKKLFENAGVGIKTFRMLGGIRKGNVPLFLKQMNEILEKNPGLKDQLTQLNVFNEDDRILLASLDGQSGTMTDFYSGPNLTAEEKDPFPYEAALPAGVALGKYGPQVLKLLKNIGGKSIRTVGSPTAAGLFAYDTIKDRMEEGESLPRAVIDKEVGFELLFPEIAKQLSSKAATSAPGILSTIGRFALNPIGKAARVFTPAGAVITGAGLAKDYYDFVQRELERKAADPEAYKAEQEEQMGIAAANGGLIRKRFADGPEDPSKRNFMKILGGLASLPLVGRFFKIGEKAAPVIDAVKTEAAKGKPEWFDALVNKVIRMGEDVTDRFATKDRETVNQINIGDGETVRVYRDIDEGAVRVEYESPDNVYGDQVVLEYKKPLPDEGDPRPTAEFNTAESGPVGRVVGPDDVELDVDEVGGTSIEDLDSDVSKLKEFATGQKPTMKEIVQNKKRKDKAARITDNIDGAASDAIVRRQGDYDPSDYED